MVWQPPRFDRIYLSATDGAVAPDDELIATSVSLLPHEVQLLGGDVVSEIAIPIIQPGEQLEDTNVGDFFIVEETIATEDGFVDQSTLVVDIGGSEAPQLGVVNFEQGDPEMAAEIEPASSFSLASVASPTASQSSSAGTAAEVTPIAFADPVFESEAVSPAPIVTGTVFTPNTSVPVSSVDPFGDIELEIVAPESTPPPPPFNDPFFEEF